MKILVTGGHLAPALSVISKLKDKDVVYVGRKYALEGDRALSLEYQVIKDLGIPFFAITTGRLQRKFSKHTIPSFLKLPVGFSQSIYILKHFKPDIVLGFGGYVSLPIVIAAYFLKIPIVIHEQTFETGIANKIASRFATKICISWKSCENFFPKGKTVLTGNPLRKEILDLKKETKKENRGLPLLYITGGSLGSHFINNLVKQSLKDMLKSFKIVHQTGDAKKFNDFEELSKIKQSLADKSNNYTIVKHLSPVNSAKVLNDADIVVSRAGINTVSELLYLNKPSLLIPISFSQKDEQLKNAKMLKLNGLAEVLEEKDATHVNFVEILSKMLKQINSYKPNHNDEISQNAPQKIIEVLNNVYHEKKTKK